MEERKVYKEPENRDEKGNLLDIVSDIIYKDGKIYCLCDDGKFYEKINENQYKILDESNKKNIKLIKDLNDLFQPGMIDIINYDDYDLEDESIED